MSVHCGVEQSRIQSAPMPRSHHTVLVFKIPPIAFLVSSWIVAASTHPTVTPALRRTVSSNGQPSFLQEGAYREYADPGPASAVESAVPRRGSTFVASPRFPSTTTSYIDETASPDEDNPPLPMPPLRSFTRQQGTTADLDDSLELGGSMAAAERADAEADWLPRKVRNLSSRKQAEAMGYGWGGDEGEDHTGAGSSAPLLYSELLRQEDSDHKGGGKGAAGGDGAGGGGQGGVGGQVSGPSGTPSGGGKGGGKGGDGDGAGGGDGAGDGAGDGGSPNPGGQTSGPSGTPPSGDGKGGGKGGDGDGAGDGDGGSPNPATGGGPPSVTPGTGSASSVKADIKKQLKEKAQKDKAWLDALKRNESAKALAPTVNNTMVVRYCPGTAEFHERRETRM